VCIQVWLSQQTLLQTPTHASTVWVNPQAEARRAAAAAVAQAAAADARHSGERAARRAAESEVRRRTRFS